MSAVKSVSSQSKINKWNEKEEAKRHNYERPRRITEDQRLLTMEVARKKHAETRTRRDSHQIMTIQLENCVRSPLFIPRRKLIIIRVLPKDPEALFSFFFFSFLPRYFFNFQNSLLKFLFHSIGYLWRWAICIEQFLGLFLHVRSGPMLYLFG